MAETKAIHRLGRTACAGITGSGIPGAAMGRNRRIFVVRAGSAGEAGHVPSPEVPATWCVFLGGVLIRIILVTRSWW